MSSDLFSFQFCPIWKVLQNYLQRVKQVLTLLASSTFLAEHPVHEINQFEYFQNHKQIRMSQFQERPVLQELTPVKEPEILLRHLSLVESRNAPGLSEKLDQAKL